MKTVLIVFFFGGGGEQSKDVVKSNVLQYYLNTVGRRTLSSGIWIIELSRVGVLRF